MSTAAPPESGSHPSRAAQPAIENGYCYLVLFKEVVRDRIKARLGSFPSLKDVQGLLHVDVQCVQERFLLTATYGLGGSGNRKLRPVSYHVETSQSEHAVKASDVVNFNHHTSAPIGAAGSFSLRPDATPFVPKKSARLPRGTTSPRVYMVGKMPVAVSSIQDCLLVTRARNLARNDTESECHMRLAAHERWVFRKGEQDERRGRKEAAARRKARVTAATRKQQRREALFAPKIQSVGWSNRHMLRPALAGMDKETRRSWYQKINPDFPAPTPKNKIVRETISEMSSPADWIESPALKQKKQEQEALRLVNSGEKFVAVSIQDALNQTAVKERTRPCWELEWTDAFLAAEARAEARRERRDLKDASKWLFKHAPCSVKDAIRLTAARDRADPNRRPGSVKALEAEGWCNYKAASKKLRLDCARAERSAKPRQERATKSFIARSRGNTIIGHRELKQDRSRQVAHQRRMKTGDNKASARHKVHKTIC